MAIWLITPHRRVVFLIPIDIFRFNGQTSEFSISTYPIDQRCQVAFSVTIFLS